MRSRTIAALAPALFLALHVTASASTPLRYVETEDLRLIYFDPQLTYLAPHVGRCFESSMRFQREFLEFRPSEPVTVLLTDFGDHGNAAAGAVPRNMLQFNVAPMDFTFESFVAPERMYMLMNHELVHVVTTDLTARSDRRARTVFRGKVRPIEEHPESILYHYLTTPRNAAPRWFKEGVAVFNETWNAGGIGRAQGSYDEMVFRAMVRDTSRFYDPLGLVSEGVKTSFQVEANSYLYGTRFLSYLAYSRSPEHVLRWVRRTDGTRWYYASEFRNVFGIAMSDAWQEWIRWEDEFQEENLERIREYPVTPYRDLSSRALGSVSRAHLNPDDRVIYVAFNYPGVVAHVGAISIEDGSVRRIVEVTRPAGYGVTSLTFDPGEKTLFYTADNREYRDLRSLDPVTGKSRTLIEDARIGDLAFNRRDRSIWGLRYLNGIVTLVRVPDPHVAWEQIVSWPYGEVPYDLDLSPDGALLSASVAEISGRHVLRVWNTEDLGKQELPDPVAEVDFGTTIPMNFVFSPDGDALYGSTYYTGVANVVRYDFATGTLDTLTNTETGFFRPVPIGADSLLVFRYTGDGFVPSRIDGLTPLEDVNAIEFLGQRTIEAHPELQDWQVALPSEIPFESMVVREGPYRPLREIGVESMYPVVEGYKDSAAAGLHFELSDYLALAQAGATVSYTPDRSIPSGERLHLDLSFRRLNWRARATLNDADFYDLFGPTKRGLKGYSAEVGYDRLLVWDEPRRMELDVHAAHYGDLERLPGYQNVATPFKDLSQAAVKLHYQNLRGSLGHVDDEKGYQWDLVAAANYVQSDLIPRLRGDFDVGVPLPLRHSSVWLRTSAGRAFGDRQNAYANFYFGGFGNNWVDRYEIQRYREHYAFPGLEINEAGGRDYAKAMLEWNLPPLRFERAGWQSFHLTWARTSIFASGLLVEPNEPTLRQAYRNAGVQMDWRFTLLHNHDLTLSIGYAVAFESGAASRNEFMASLSLFP